MIRRPPRSTLFPSRRSSDLSTIHGAGRVMGRMEAKGKRDKATGEWKRQPRRSEEHTSELQSQSNLVCRLLLEKKKNNYPYDDLLHVVYSSDCLHSDPSTLPF